MNTNKQKSKTGTHYFKNTFRIQKFPFILVFLSGIILYPIQLANSKEIFLTCTGKFEINRGELIKPDWETSYLTINLDGSKSFINDKGIKKVGSTVINSKTFTITERDNSNRVKTKYKIDGTHGNYVVDYPQRNRTLIGTCQKGRG